MVARRVFRICGASRCRAGCVVASTGEAAAVGQKAPNSVCVVAEGAQDEGATLTLKSLAV